MNILESWRANQQWSTYLGQQGRVLASSHMEVAATDQVGFTPYSYVLVEVAGERLSLMGAVGEDFQAGDQVRIVLRKLKREAAAEVITYGLKVTKQGVSS
jgi:uncharacterized OB-fold protein